MFRPMRRKKQEMPREETIAIIKKATSGVLAVLGDDGYPYAVPLSHFYNDGKLYFHCAAEGHKLDAIQNCEKASFCVVDRDEVVPERYTTYFRSAIAFGRIRILKDKEEIYSAIDKLAQRFNPGDDEGRAKEIAQSMSRLCVLEMTIEHLTGKEARELMERRK